MKKLVVSIKDVKAKEFLGLVMVKTREEAERHFLFLIQSGGIMAKFPRDYQLFVVGSIESESGILEAGIPEDMTPYSLVDEIEARFQKLEEAPPREEAPKMQSLRKEVVR